MRSPAAPQYLFVRRSWSVSFRGWRGDFGAVRNLGGRSSNDSSPGAEPRKNLDSLRITSAGLYKTKDAYVVLDDIHALQLSAADESRFWNDQSQSVSSRKPRPAEEAGAEAVICPARAEVHLHHVRPRCRIGGWNDFNNVPIERCGQRIDLNAYM